MQIYINILKMIISFNINCKNIRFPTKLCADFAPHLHKRTCSVTLNVRVLGLYGLQADYPWHDRCCHIYGSLNGILFLGCL